ncbi:hypothetical protein ZWY2020_039506 [Hordeum vulgare]|nr:hypothetical protein ZWY2020_039506 [Hordeum vulgare]
MLFLQPTIRSNGRNHTNEIAIMLGHDVIPRYKALQIAVRMGLDLVELLHVSFSFSVVCASLGNFHFSWLSRHPRRSTGNQTVQHWRLKDQMKAVMLHEAGVKGCEDSSLAKAEGRNLMGSTSQFAEPGTDTA